MLCLSFAYGESLYIGDNVQIKVEKAAGDRVRLAIAAPDDVPVNRESVLRSKRADGIYVPSVGPAKTINTIPGQSRHPSLGRTPHDAERDGAEDSAS